MTFRARLTLAYLVLLTLALSGFGIWVYAYVDRNLHQEFSGSVQRQSKQLAQVLASDYDNSASRAGDILDLEVALAPCTSTVWPGRSPDRTNSIR